MGLKQCTKCFKKIALAYFSKDTSKPDGLYSSCKWCVGKKDGRVYSPLRGKIPYIDNDGYVRYKGQRMHRIVMGKFLGRELESIEHVHHINGDKTDNRMENLAILSKSDHHRIHKRNDGRNVICVSCGRNKYVVPSAVGAYKENSQCLNCRKKYGYFNRKMS